MTEGVLAVPDVYLIGAPKCGTTSLARWLGEHRDVYVSVPKEPYFWAADYPRMRAHYGFDTRAAYEALYDGTAARSARRRVDGSTTYLYSECAVPDIIGAAAGARFVVCVRNPVDLLMSYHRTQLVALNEAETDFGRAWRRSLSGGLPDTDPLDPKLLDYPRVGRLGAALQRVLSTVSGERVHVVLLEELAADPGRTWNRLCTFLELDPEPTPGFEVHNASNKAARSAVLRRLTHRPPPLLEAPVRLLRQWSRTTPNRVVARAKARMWRPAATPSVSADVRTELADYFRADVELLAGLLDRDLVHWTSAGR